MSPGEGGRGGGMSSKEREEKCPGENMVVRGQEGMASVQFQNVNRSFYLESCQCTSAVDTVVYCSATPGSCCRFLVS
jgi:hypothetical protein